MDNKIDEKWSQGDILLKANGRARSSTS